MEETADAASQQQEATALLRQLERFFSVFRLRERELVSECSLCACEACARSGDLRLKIIAHTGTILVKQVRQFEEIAGEDVIVAHRLLKNSVPGDEYLLLTEPFHALSGPAQEGRSVSLMEKWDGHGSLKIHVHYPPDAVRPSAAPVSVWRKIRTHLWLDRHMVKRLFSKSERTFHHLPARTREEPRP
jgi:class 3 adenylate cyclase